MDTGALFLVLFAALMVGWLFESQSKPATPTEKLEKAAREFSEAMVKKGQGGS